MNHPVCSSIEFYEGAFSRYYDDFVNARMLPDPAALFHVCRPFVSAAAPAILLDVGIGSGLSAKPFTGYLPNLVILGVDGSEAMLALCRTRLPMACLRHHDFRHGVLPYEDGLSDITINQGCLHMLENACGLIKDMMRVTRPQGLVAFNYEASHDDNNRYRFNDAAMTAREKKSILTYQHRSSEIEEAIVKNGGQIVQRTSRLAMQKMDGTPVYFTDVLARKL